MPSQFPVLSMSLAAVQHQVLCVYSKFPLIAVAVGSLSLVVISLVLISVVDESHNTAVLELISLIAIL